jgi:hypothetical protein
MGAGKHVSVQGTGRHKHGDMIKSISPLDFHADANWAIAGLVSFADAGYISSSGAGKVAVAIPMVVGERLKSLTFARYGNASANFTSIKVFKLTAAGAVTDITAAATSDAAPAASWADKAVDITDTTAADGDVFWVVFDGSATGLRIGSIRVTYDRP